MKTYVIICAGCDEDTEIRLDLTDEEAVIVRRVAEAVTAASQSLCQPTMSIEPDSKETK